MTADTDRCESDCPAEKELASLVREKGESPTRNLRSHLQTCELCRVRLHTLVDQEIEFMGLRSPEPSNLLADEDGLAELLKRASRVVEASAAVNTSASFTGKQFGNYRIVRQINRGGMGTVYEAEHLVLGKRVALKIISPDRIVSDDAIPRFQREIKAAGAVRHLNLVQATDAGFENGIHFLVMELVDGIDLAGQPPLNIADACEVVRQAALGLQHVKNSGMVHRDVKPANLMLTKDGTVKVADLGLARFDDGDDLSRSGVAMGTYDFMAPEQLRDSHAVDYRADIYSLGATLYALLCGRPMFGDSFGAPAKIAAVLNDIPPPVCEHNPTVPRELSTFIDRMLAKSPADRVGSWDEVLAEMVLHSANSNLAQIVDLTQTAELTRASVSTHRFSQPPAPDTTPSKPQTTSNESIPSKSPTRFLLPAGGLIVACLFALLLLNKSRPNDAESQPEDSKNLQFTAPGAPVSPWALVPNPTAIAGVESWTIDTQRNRGSIGTVEFSPDGKFVASTGDGTIRVRNASNGGIVHCFSFGPPRHTRHDQTGGGISWSHDGTLWSLSKTGVTRVNVDTGVVEQILNLRTPDFPQPFVASSRNEHVAVCYHDRLALVATDDESFHYVDQGYRSCAWSPTDDHLAAVNSNSNSVDIVTTKGVVVCSKEFDRVGNIAWSCDGRHLCLTGDRVTVLSLDDSAGAPELSVIAELDEEQKNVAWSPRQADQFVVGARHGYEAKLISVNFAKPHCRIEHTFDCSGVIQDIDWSNNQIAVGLDGGGIDTFHVDASGIELAWPTLGYSTNTTDASWAIDGNRLWVSQEHGLVAIDHKGNTVMRKQGAAEKPTLALPDGSILLECNDELVRLANSGTQYKLSIAKTRTMAISSDRKWLAILEETPSRIRVWKTAELLTAGTSGLPECVGMIEVEPAGLAPLLGIVSWADKVRIVSMAQSHLSVWDPTNSVPNTEITQRFYDGVSCIESPVSSSLLSVGYSNGSLCVFDLAESNPLRYEFQGRSREYVNSIEWLNDNETFLATHDDGTVNYWALTSQTPLRTISGPIEGRLSKNDRFLASPMLSNTRWKYSRPGYFAEVWNLETASVTGRILSIAQEQSLVVSADGNVSGAKSILGGLIYIAATSSGQRTYTPEEFQKQFGWQNDRSKVRLFEN